MTVAIALAGIPALMLHFFLVNVLAARQHSARSVVLAVAWGATGLVAGAMGCWVGGIRGIYLAAVPATTILIVGVLLALRQKGGMRPLLRDAVSWTELREGNDVVRIVAATYVATATTSIQILIARYATLAHGGAETAGMLQACLGIALSLGAVLAPSNTGWFAPQINRAGLPADKMRIANRFLPRLLLLFGLGALPFVLFPELAITILFSEQFVPAARALTWFVAWQGVLQVANVYQQLLLGIDDPLGYAIVATIGNGAGAIASMLLVAPYGIAGVGAGLVSGALLSAAMGWQRLRTKHQLIR